MNAFAALLAAVDFQTIKFIVVMIVFLLAGLAQLVAKLQKIQPPAGRPRPPRPVAPDVADEIEEFMRRAANRRNVQGTQPVAAPTPPPTPAAVQPGRAEVSAEQPVGGQVEEHVKKYLDAQDFSRRSQELGEEVAQVDRDVGQHLHEVFDHQVSRLEVVPGEAAAPPVAVEPSDLSEASPEIPATFATGLLGLINSPDSLRQAIILNEIIHRPEERWG
jgi:hypothetical protein